MKTLSIEVKRKYKIEIDEIELTCLIDALFYRLKKDEMLFLKHTREYSMAYDGLNQCLKNILEEGKKR